MPLTLLHHFMQEVQQMNELCEGLIAAVEAPVGASSRPTVPCPSSTASAASTLSADRFKELIEKCKYPKGPQVQPLHKRGRGKPRQQPELYQGLCAEGEHWTWDKLCPERQQWYQDYCGKIARQRAKSLPKGFKAGAIKFGIVRRPEQAKKV